MPPKKLKPSVLLFFAAVFSFLIIGSQSASAATTCGNIASVISGPTSVTADCHISSGYESVDKGDLGIVAGQTLTIDPGATLVINATHQINLLSNTSRIIVSKNPSGYVKKGFLCAPDANNDKVPDSLNWVLVETTPANEASKACPAGYTRKSDLTTLNTCVNGYHDYDKDGDGAGAYGCYMPSGGYNIVSNNYDCDDSNASIKNGTAITTYCGVGTCGGSGTDTCTNGSWVTTATCTTSAAACCDASGNYKVANTPISTCLKCNGAAASPVNQASSEDLGNNCATGALGSGTSCQASNCSGTGDYCGSLVDGTLCNYGAWSGWGGASGTCAASRSRSYYNCSAGSCSATAAGTDYDTPQYAPAAGQVWNGSAWAAASCSLYCGSLSGVFCTGQQVQQSAYGCNTSGSCDAVTARATCNGSTCGGGENSRCSGGSCVNQCSDGIDNDADGWIDSLDSDCNASAHQQCHPSDGACCDANGNFKALNTPISVCLKCSGTSAIPVNQSPGEDWGNNCSTGAYGTATSCQSNYCSGTGDYCGSIANGTRCNETAWSAWTGANGVCTVSQSRDYYTCSAGSCSTTVNTEYNTSYITIGNVWWNSATAAVSSTINCGVSSTNSCSAQQPQGNALGCNGLGNCTYQSSSKVSVGSPCPGSENNYCTNGSCSNDCFDGVDNDGDGYIDAADTDCGRQCLSGACCDTSTYQFRPSSYTCNASAGPCDVAENCTGSSAACPTNAYVAAGTLCSSSAGVCDYNDYCTGYSAGCSDSKVGAGTVCRASVSAACDPAETCDGVNNNCPPDVTNNGALCASPSGPCQNAAFCVGNTCPAQTYKSSSTVCSTCTLSNPGNGACARSGTGQYCSGSSAACSGSTFGCSDYGSNGQVWWNSNWYTNTTSIYCGTGSWYCSGQTPQVYTYGCNGAGSCSTFIGNVISGSACAGTEASWCVNGYSNCVNYCTRGGTSQTGSPYNDDQNLACFGYSQCTSGDCCNVSNGSFKPAGTVISACLQCTGSSATSVAVNNGSFCGYGAFGAWSGNDGDCRASQSRIIYGCSAGSCSANIGTDYNYQYCQAGQVWVQAYNSCIAASGTYNCNVGGATCYSHNQMWFTYAGCGNYTGTCDYTPIGQFYSYTCNYRGGMACDYGFNYCVPCTQNSDCYAGEYCINYACTAGAYGYKDADKDGYGAPNTYQFWPTSSSYNVVSNGNDCNDANAAVGLPNFAPDAHYCACNRACGGATWTQYDFSCSPVATHVTTCSNGCPSGLVQNCWVPRLQQGNFSGSCVSGQCAMTFLPDIGSCSTNFCWGEGSVAY